VAVSYAWVWPVAGDELDAVDQVVGGDHGRSVFPRCECTIYGTRRHRSGWRRGRARRWFTGCWVMRPRRRWTCTDTPLMTICGPLRRGLRGQDRVLCPSCSVVIRIVQGSDLRERVEPPVGIEPTTFSLRGAEGVSGRVRTWSSEANRAALRRIDAWPLDDHRGHHRGMRDA